MEVDVQRVTVLVLLALFAVLLFSFDQILKVKKYIREPTYIPSKLPYCGHIIGLLKHKMYYYSTLTYARISSELRKPLCNLQAWEKREANMIFLATATGSAYSR